jgi:uncharacterized protein YbbC (DUF1343 family)
MRSLLMAFGLLAVSCGRVDGAPMARASGTAAAARALAREAAAARSAPAASGAPAAARPAAVPAAPRFDGVDRAVRRAIERGEVPGAVVVVVRRGEVALRRAYGLRAKEPAPEAMTPETVFDLASLTKPLATTLSVFALADRGRVRLSDRAAKFVPDFAQNGKEDVTIEQLLLHTSGLPAVTPLEQWQGGKDAALQRLHRVGLEAPPGSRVIYSDLGFVVLGEVVERVAQRSLASFASEAIYAPLGLAATGFRPGAELAARAAPTEARDQRLLRGEVHDPRAHLLGGVAGHAGLFSNADDLAVLARMLLGRGALDGRTYLTPRAFERMIRPHDAGDGRARAPGWELLAPLRSPGGEPAAGGFGHTGFTGTSIALYPTAETAIIVLTNRLHPDGKGDVRRLRKEISEAVAAAPDGRAPVITGLDALARDDFALLRGRRVGLVTNAAAIDAEGTPATVRIARAAGVKLAAIFSPEHGLDAKADARVRDGRDPSTGAPIHSLYGARERPTEAQLREVDTLVVDLPNVGARFYTYVTTLGHVLEAAAAHDKRVIVLDRPNAIGADRVEGPLLDADLQSFTGYHPLPVRHGMTMGELARLFDTERGIGARPEIVRMEGYERAATFPSTGLRWIPPSPNLRSPRAAILYPGVALLERTNVSVGRGTDRPFERLGAPWIDGGELARSLSTERLGVRFEPTTFVPQSGPFAGERCDGVSIAVADPGSFAPVRLGLAIARALRRLHPGTFRPEGVLPMLGHRAAYRALVEGKSLDAIEATWREDLEGFRRVRARHLLY